MQIQEALGDWATRPGPLYRRLATAIGVAIERGDLPPGSVLPPERSLARRLAIGRSTVAAAYALLHDADQVERRQGSGTWIRGAARHTTDVLPRASLRVAALHEAATVIDLATAALPAHDLIRALVADLATQDSAAILASPGYLPGGLPALRQALAARLTAQDLPTNPDQILVTTGTQQALSLICTHVLQSGDTAVVEDPTSPGILDVLQALPVAIRAAQPVAEDYGELLRLVDRCQARLAYLLPTLGPQGRILAQTARSQLADHLAERSALVVEDTSQAGLSFQPPPPPLAAFTQASNLVTIGSLTKLHWGGLRLGWIRGPGPLIAGLTRAKARTDLGSPVLNQLLATRLLDSEDQVRAERVAMLRASLACATTLLRHELPEVSWRPPDGGLNLWLRLPAGTGTAFSEVATRLGVAVVPGALLSPHGAADDHIRLVYARPNKVLDEGVRRLAAAWRHYQRVPTATPYPHPPVLT